MWFDSQFFRMTFFPAFLWSTSSFVIFANFIQLEIWKSVCCIGPVQNVFIFGEFAQQRSESAKLWSRPENSIFHRTPEIWISSAGKSMNFKLSQKTPTKLKVNWSWGSKFGGNSWGVLTKLWFFSHVFQASTNCPLTDCQLWIRAGEWKKSLLSFLILTTLYSSWGSLDPSVDPLLRQGTNFHRLKGFHMSAPKIQNSFIMLLGNWNSNLSAKTCLIVCPSFPISSLYTYIKDTLMSYIYEFSTVKSSGCWIMVYKYLISWATRILPPV